MRRRKVYKWIVALTLAILVGTTTTVFSVNESNPWESKKRILLYEEVPRPDDERQEDLKDADITEKESVFTYEQPDQNEIVVIAFGSVNTSKLEFEMELENNNINLTEDDIKRIEKIDMKNSRKNINNYKKLLNDFNVSEKQQKELRKYFDKGYTPKDIFYAYEYLYRNYGTFKELEVMLEARKQGKGWLQVFADYESENGVYEPIIFPKGYLDQLMKELDVSMDDVAIAERLVQKVYSASDQKAINNVSNSLIFESDELRQLSELDGFEELLGLRKEGDSWESIKAEMGLLNNKSQDKKMDISLRELDALLFKYAAMTEDEVMDSLIQAQILNENPENIIISKKAKKSNAEIFFEYLQKKYK